MPSNLATFARCRALALAGMIEAGGKPCWVATGARSRPVAAKAAPAPASVKATHVVGPLSDAERVQLASCPPRVLASISRALERLSSVPVPSGMTGTVSR